MSMNTPAWGMIATWRMAIEGVTKATELLKQQGTVRDAVMEAVTWVEDFPYYKSVGYGGLPNEEGEVELDAAYMDGSTLAIGAVAAIKNMANPVLIAERLSHERFNSVLVGDKARDWALKEGFQAKTMLTERAQQFYLKRKRETLDRGLSPYSGHDTVGIIGLDCLQNMAVATSTSGLFMKRPGRVGDSPLPGCGFYADSQIGAATATGLGEDLMKGCISYEIVQRIGRGAHPQQAADSAVFELEQQLLTRYGCVSDLSVVCMDHQGRFGVATNIDNFSFSVATHALAPTVYVAKRQGDETVYQPADQQWLEAYEQRIRAPIV